jgi:DNA-binding MarR family transcriptional regulator
MTDPATVPDALAHRIARLHRLLREATGTAGTHSIARLGVLAMLDERGPCKITELAALERITQPAMTTLIGRLERDGLVQRHTSTDDRRAVCVTLTPAGRDELVRIRHARGQALATLLARCDDADRSALEAALPALDRLLAAADPAKTSEV